MRRERSIRDAAECDTSSKKSNAFAWQETHPLTGQRPPPVRCRQIQPRPAQMGATAPAWAMTAARTLARRTCMSNYWRARLFFLNTQDGVKTIEYFHCTCMITDEVNARVATFNSMTAVFYGRAFQFNGVEFQFDCQHFMITSFDSRAEAFNRSIRWRITIRN